MVPWLCLTKVARRDRVLQGEPTSLLCVLAANVPAQVPLNRAQLTASLSPFVDYGTRQRRRGKSSRPSNGERHAGTDVWGI